MSIDSGKIRIGENDVNPDEPDPRGNLYYLGHSVGLYPGLTGYENLAFISGLYGKTSRNISNVLIKVRLDSAQDKLVKFYSQGMLQRLKLASAIILRILYAASAANFCAFSMASSMVPTI